MPMEHSFFFKLTNLLLTALSSLLLSRAVVSGGYSLAVVHRLLTAVASPVVEQDRL